jgi:hypothetical protein
MKLSVIAIGILMAGMMACQQQNSTNEDQEHIVIRAAAGDLVPAALNGDEETVPPESNKNIPWDSIEVFQVDQALLNNKLHLNTNLRQFELLWGKPDSIITPDYDEVCAASFEEEFQYILKDGSEFEMFKDSIVFSEIRFCGESFVTYNGITLNKNTTLADIKKRFPHAVKQAEYEGVPEEIRLRDTVNKDSDSAILMIFKEGKLEKLVNFVPC